MTVTNTLRFLLKKFSSGGDPHPTREEHNLMIDAIENNAVMGSQGITAARPAAGKGLRLFFDETAKRAWWDDGANWQDLNPNGGGGPGTTIAPGVDAVEGVSVRAARADHTHKLPLATNTAHGALSAADKGKLDAATASPTANALALRDANGRVGVGTPTDVAHAATKAYVDGLIVQSADYTDTMIENVPVIVPGLNPLAGPAKPADVRWRVFEGMVRTTTGAGGETRTAANATDGNGYAGLWFGYQGLPTFQGIYSVQVTGYHAIESFQYVPTLSSVSLTRVKWRGRRIDGSGWANGYNNVDIMVRVVGW